MTNPKSDIIIIICNILRITTFSLLLICLVFSCVNYFEVNNNTEKCIEDSYSILKNINKSTQNTLNDLITKDITLGTLKDINVKVEISNLDVFKNTLTEIEKSKKYIFDSNTITFIISFILIGLVTIVLGLDNRISRQLNKHIAVAKKQEDVNALLQQVIFSERRVNELFSKIQTIRSVAIEINIRLNYVAPQYKVAIEYLRKADELVHEINQELKHIPSLKIYKETQVFIINTFDKIEILTKPSPSNSNAPYKLAYCTVHASLVSNISSLRETLNNTKISIIEDGDIYKKIPK